jgi:hypothetical protein
MYRNHEMFVKFLLNYDSWKSPIFKIILGPLILISLFGYIYQQKNMAGSTTGSLRCDANRIYRNKPQKLPVLVWFLAKLNFVHLVEKAHGHHSLPSFNRDFVLLPQWFAGMIKCGKRGRYGKRGMVTYREEGKKKSWYALVWRMDIWSHINQATAQQSFWNLGSNKSLGEDFWEFILGPWGSKASTGEQSDISPEVKWHER